VKATSAVTGVDETTVYLGTLPASHNFPLACPGVLGALFAGGTSVMLPSPEPVRAFATIEREGVTVAAAVPAVAQRWLEYGHDHPGASLDSLLVLQVGGSRMPDPDEVVIATQGRPVSEADEIRIVDEAGRDVPDGVPGSILTRGPYTPRGYFRAAEHNSRAFVDGWYSSGDIVLRRPDGNLIVLGRDKDIINRGGEKISAEEVENVVYRLPEVDLAAAVSMPDPVLGERLCLFVTLLGGEPLTLDVVRDFMTAQGLAAFKLPERIEIVDSMPMTKVGKIDKRALRETIAEKLAAIE
jgi:non-ribosomal peptide synthetase component E (peptide arylation enzyme)